MAVTGVRIATGTRGHQVICWTFHNNILVPVFSIQLSTTIPKGIVFVYGQRDVYVWGMYDGQMWVTELTNVLAPNEYLKAYSLSRWDNHQDDQFGDSDIRYKSFNVQS